MRWSVSLQGCTGSDHPHLAFGSDGRLYMAVHSTSDGSSQIRGFDPATGTTTLRLPVTGADEIYTDAEGLVAVDLHTGVSYFSYTGQRTAFYPLEDSVSHALAAAGGPDGLVYVAGYGSLCTDSAGTPAGHLRVTAYGPQDRRWTWQDSGANSACAQVTVAATPGGGAVVGGQNPDGAQKYFSIDDQGKLRWDHPVVPLAGQVEPGLPNVHVDSQGVVVLEHDYAQITAPDTGLAVHQEFEFLNGRTGNPVTAAPVSFLAESPLGAIMWQMAITPGEVYFLLSSASATSGTSIAALRIAGLGSDYSLMANTPMPDPGLL